MYKAIFLDLDDTVFDFNACSELALKSTFSLLELPYQEAYFPLFLDIDNYYWDKQKQGELTIPEVLDARSDKFTEEVGASELSRKFQITFSEELATQTETEPLAREAIEILSSNIPVYATSNGRLWMQHARLEKAGLLKYFRDIFVSDDIGHEKPSVAYFQECLLRAKLNHKEVLMLGDSLEADIAGAEKANIDSCWYNPQAKPLPDSYHPTYIINNFTELKDIL